MNGMKKKEIYIYRPNSLNKGEDNVNRNFKKKIAEKIHNQRITKKKKYLYYYVMMYVIHDEVLVLIQYIMHLFYKMVEQHLQDCAAIVGCAADEEIVGGRAP